LKSRVAEGDFLHGLFGPGWLAEVITRSNMGIPFPLGTPLLDLIRGGDPKGFSIADAIDDG
jgi:hypothetical protein